MLLTEYRPFHVDRQLAEATLKENRPLTVKGVIQRAEAKNQNGGGSVDEKMKYGGGGNIMIKTVEVSMKVPEKQKRGTGAAMTGTKFSGTF